MNLRRSISYILDIGMLLLMYFFLRNAWSPSLVPNVLLPAWTMIFEISQLIFFILFSLLFVSDYGVFKPYIDKFNLSVRWYWLLAITPLIFLNFVYNFATIIATLESSAKIPLYIFIAIICISTISIGTLLFLRFPLARNNNTAIKEKIWAMISNHTTAYFILLGFASIYSSVLSFYTSLRTTAFAPPKQKVHLSESTKTLYLFMMNFCFGIIISNMLNFELYVKMTGDSYNLFRLPIVFILIYLPYKSAILMVDSSWKKSRFDAIWPFIYLLAQLGIIQSI